MAHEIDFKIYGDDMQFVEIELDSGETVVSEAGAMMYMREGIEMEAVFSDREGGFMDKLIHVGKRVLTGESLFLATFTHRGAGKSRVAFAAPYPGKIVPVDLKKYGTMLCQKDSFLCAAKGINIDIAFTKRFGAGLFGGEGFILQKIDGDGLVFLHAGGTVHELELQAGESLRVDTGCLVAFHESISYDVQFNKNIKTALFGGEGLFFTVLQGPGKVFLQSLPFSRLANRIYKAMPQTGGSREEGSLLGGLGRMIGGDMKL